MKNAERRNITAPKPNMNLIKAGSPALIFSTDKLKPANVPGRDALIIGSINRLFNSDIKLHRLSQS